jgi:hypothetical protein
MSEPETGTTSDDGWEELPPVDADEIDRVIAALNDLMERTTSRVILDILEDACCDLAELVDAEDEDDELAEAA